MVCAMLASLTRPLARAAVYVTGRRALAWKGGPQGQPARGSDRSWCERFSTPAPRRGAWVPVCPGYAGQRVHGERITRVQSDCSLRCGAGGAGIAERELGQCQPGQRGHAVVVTGLRKRGEHGDRVVDRVLSQETACVENVQ